MKNLIYFAFIALVASCSDLQPNFIPEQNIDNAIQSQTRTSEEAEIIATKALSLLGQTNSRSNTQRISSTKPIITLSKSRSNSICDTLMYIVNFSDSSGYALIAANRDYEGLVAITESGNLNEDLSTDNPGLALYLECATEYLTNNTNLSDTAILNPFKPFEPGPGIPVKKYVNDTIVEKKDRLVNVAWGQGYPFNIYFDCPYAGCSNIAVLQALTYLKYPSSISLTYPNADKNSLDLDWYNISKHLRFHPKDKTPTNGTIYMGYCSLSGEEAHKDLGRLCKEIGYRSGSATSTNNTTTTPVSGTRATLSEYFNISDEVEYEFDIIKNATDSNKITIIYGARKNGAHLWLIDGYIMEKLRKKLYQRVDGGPWTYVNETITVLNQYIHMNWGWDGTSNGYFSSGVFNASDIYKPDYNNINPATNNYDRYISIFTVGNR